MSKPQPEFFEIKDQKMNARILDACARHGIAVTFWLKDQALKLDTVITQHVATSSRLSIRLPGGITAAQVRDALAKQGATDVFCSFQLDNIQFFLKAKCTNELASSSEVVVLEVPKSIFKVQRRANYRVTLPRKEAPKLTTILPGKTVELAFRVLDISAGGVGFAAPVELKDVLVLGAVLEDIRFKIRGLEIRTRGVVKFAKESKSDEGEKIIRIGVQFSGLKPNFEKHIVQFTLEESRKIFSLLH